MARLVLNCEGVDLVTLSLERGAVSQPGPTRVSSTTYDTLLLGSRFSKECFPSSRIRALPDLPLVQLDSRGADKSNGLPC
jgi:hypothetical protein